MSEDIEMYEVDAFGGEDVKVEVTGTDAVRGCIDLAKAGGPGSLVGASRSLPVNGILRAVIEISVTGMTVSEAQREVLARLSPVVMEKVKRRRRRKGSVVGGEGLESSGDGTQSGVQVVGVWFE